MDGKEGHQTKAIDLDSVPLALSCVDINQRDPKMEMKVVTNDPALIGEWFKIYVNLSNNEKDRVEDVSVIASLEEASDPLIADTTRLTLDYKYDTYHYSSEIRGLCLMKCSRLNGMLPNLPYFFGIVG